MFTDADITRITHQLGRALGPVAVGTFGSYANGTAHDRSDLDLLVIHEQTAGAPLHARAVRGHLPNVFWPLDIHVFAPKEFERRAREIQSFEWIIMRQAKLYYWREDAPRLVPALFGKTSVTASHHNHHDVV
jgi:predicted nucleotidyltransferase